MELKHGMRVRGKIEGIDIKDGKLYKSGGGRWHLCQNKVKGCDIPDKLGYKFSWRFTNLPQGTFSDGIELYPFDSTNIEDIYEGCRIKNEEEEREVLGICGMAVITSLSNCFNIAQGVYTIEELKEQGFTLVPEVEPEPEPSLVGKEVSVTLDGKTYKARIVE
jgi:hypothetical protein